MTEPKTYHVSIGTDATIDEIAQWVLAAIHRTDDLVEFVKRLDVAAADLKFCVGVRDAMNVAIAEEVDQ